MVREYTYGTEIICPVCGSSMRMKAFENNDKKEVMNYLQCEQCLHKELVDDEPNSWHKCFKNGKIILIRR